MIETQNTLPVTWTRDNLTADDLQQVDQIVRTWHSSLPAFAVPNRRLGVVQGVLHGEVMEAREEREREGTSDYSASDAQKETLDLAVPAHALAMRRNVDLDMIDVRAGMDGYGRSSQIYDRIGEVIGNLPESKTALTKDLQWLLTLVYSAMWHLPEIQSPVEVLRPKMEENENNYPPMYFAISNERGSILKPDEQEERYHHSVKCLRLIRNAHGRPRKLLWSMHAPYAELILDFRNAGRNYQTLVEAMNQMKQLNAATVVV